MVEESPVASLVLRVSRSNPKPETRNPKPSLLACVVLLMSTGCVRQSLTIKTDPPGAMVYVNDQLKGSTPVTYNFMWYGWHRVTIRKDGYQRLDDRKLLHAPPYLWIPLDLVMELLPLPIRDTRQWSYTLTPTPTLPVPQAPEIARPTPEQPLSPPAPPAVPAAPAPKQEPAPQQPTEPSDDQR